MKILLSALLFLFLVGCDRPFNTVVDNSSMKIYAAKKLEDGRLGSFEYQVRDGSRSGWTFITDKELNVGDILTIDVEKK